MKWGTYDAEVLPVQKFAQPLCSVSLDDTLTSRETRKLKHELHTTPKNCFQNCDLKPERSISIRSDEQDGDARWKSEEQRVTEYKSADQGNGQNLNSNYTSSNGIARINFQKSKLWVVSLRMRLWKRWWVDMGYVGIHMFMFTLMGYVAVSSATQ